MRAERPILSHPERQSPAQRLTSRALAGVAWATWLYLWLPVLSAILWILGLRTAYIYIVRAPNETSLLLIFAIMLICNVIVSSWSSYNYLRFVGNTMRRGTDVVPHERVGKAFGITDPATLSLLLHERRLNLHFNEVGVLVRVDALTDEDSERVVSESPLV
ncbi:MAG: poly-beta-1,6-N-acetyl-D-glucosamine biosynthesis protein PgaD [Terracidiphilus sp.]